MFDNLILNTDSYKASHYLQYPPSASAMYSYIESRGGRFDRTVFFGLQSILQDYLSKPITAGMIAEARELFAAHGEPFNEAGWQHILDVHQGRLPLRIRAVAEGSVVPTHQCLVTVESTDPAAFWLVSYLEPVLLRLWYTTTVATVSWHAKQIIRRYLQATSDDPAGQLPFKLHDFGARGVSSTESSALGGLAHLVNFMGTDTVLSLVAARRYYDEPMAGFSIPAAEHSTVTSWGREHEFDAYRNMLQQFAKPGALLAVVSDSYDLFHAIEQGWGGELREQVVASGATLVVRPDSGDPVEIVRKSAEMLAEQFGVTLNSKGYKLLNHVRLIQGDGINLQAIEAILAGLQAKGFAADNIAFGMGGALLQQCNRDTQKFAMKCSAMQVNGSWRDVYKDPVTDHGKVSKKGRVALYRRNGAYVTTATPMPSDEDAMLTVFENGVLCHRHTLAEVRARSEAR
ncbi:nicotinate phosphoribosyltransferase [Leeia sp.]|uniref:nicotinate phosphoribosyltransferase n=1 Tax=Leeia sp. TaxID=2884678 RepID=UPI0035AEF5F5